MNWQLHSITPMSDLSVLEVEFNLLIYWVQHWGKL